MSKFDEERAKKVARQMPGWQVRRMAGGLLAAKKYAEGTSAEASINAAADIAVAECKKYGWKPR